MATQDRGMTFMLRRGHQKACCLLKCGDFLLVRRCWCNVWKWNGCPFWICEIGAPASIAATTSPSRAASNMKSIVSFGSSDVVLSEGIRPIRGRSIGLVWEKSCRDYQITGCYAVLSRCCSVTSCAVCALWAVLPGSPLTQTPLRSFITVTMYSPRALGG